jgi:hypothetical protein
MNRRSVRVGISTGLATTALAAGLAAGTAPAQAAAPRHVAIVVTYRGTTVARCAPVKSSGLADLQSRYTVIVGQPPSPYAGFVFKIDGHGTTSPDDTHYWAYYHRKNGSWVYSSAGAASYHPTAGAVEGWAYDNGSQTPPKPASRSYASVCGSSEPAPPPAPAPATSAPATARPAPASTRAAPGPRSSPRTSVGTGPRRTGPRRSVAAHVRPTSAAPAGTGSAARTHPHTGSKPGTSSRPPAARRSSRGSAAARPAAAPAPSFPGASPTAASTTAVAATAAAPRSGSGAAPWAPIAALVVVAALGTGAWWRLRSGGRG